MGGMNLFDGVPLLQRRFQRFGVMPAVATTAAGLTRLVLTKDPQTLVGLVGTVGLCGVWCVVWHRRVRARARNTLIRTRGMCCTHCGYSMVALPEAGNCPECGQTYYAELAMRSWGRAAGFPAGS